ncbi:hypothetical protein [Fulvimarina sp. MAC8]|uniref:hypothetical protein n=1 Tax=Fulvimarina sp. MAC8 TaxID=3162874 RepID=UPI0032EE28DF
MAIRWRKVIMKKFLTISFATLSVLVVLQFIFAFALPYFYSGTQFCRVQPRLHTDVVTWDGYRRDIYVIEIIDNYGDIDLEYVLEALFNNGKKERGFLDRQIFFGYTDGLSLFGWSFGSLDYYRLTDRTLVSGNPEVIIECAELLRKRSN